MCRGRTRNWPSLDSVDSYLVSQGSLPFFLPETTGSDSMPLEKEADIVTVGRETVLGDWLGNCRTEMQEMEVEI